MEAMTGEEVEDRAGIAVDMTAGEEVEAGTGVGVGEAVELASVLGVVVASILYD